MSNFFPKAVFFALPFVLAPAVPVEAQSDSANDPVSPPVADSSFRIEFRLDDPANRVEGLVFPTVNRALYAAAPRFVLSFSKPPRPNFAPPTIPEKGVAVLMALGGGFLFWMQRHRTTQHPPNQGRR